MFIKIIIIVLICLIVLLAILYFVLSHFLSKSFMRMDFDNSMFISYDDIKDKYERNEYEFKSKKNSLKAYLYKGTSKDDLIVYVHGMCPGHQGYLSDIMSLVNRGYNVFTYDFTATGASSGKKYCGLNQQYFDLRNALEFLKKQDLFGYENIHLYGHSMGGYAVACMSDDIIASIVSISGFDSPVDEIISVFMKKSNKFLKFLVKAMLKMKYFIDQGTKCDIKAHKVLKKTNIKTFIIHGTNDELVDFNTVSIMSKKELINNDKVEYLVIDDEMHNKHNTIIASNECVLYQNEIMDIFNKVYEETKSKAKAKEESTKNIDKFKFNQANEELLDTICSFFESNK